MADIATLGVKVESGDLKKLDDNLNKVTQSAAKTEQATKRLSAASAANARAAGVSAESFGALSTVAARASGAFTALTTGVGAVALGVTAVVAAAATGVAMLHKFTEATIESQAAQAQLAAVLKSTNGISGQTIATLNDHAEELQKLTTFEDDAIGGAQGVLLTFTNLRGENFTEATEAVVNLAQAMGTDLRSAAMTVGKALNDPVIGMMTLQRSGVQLSGAQKEVIKRLVETGDIAEAQEIILQKLKVAFGGSAAAARDTLGGALKSLGNAFGDLFELGPAATKSVQVAIEDLIKAISDPAFKEFMALVGEGLMTAFSALITPIARVAQGVNVLSSGLSEAKNVLSDMAGVLARTKDAAVLLAQELEKIRPPKWGIFGDNPFEKLSQYFSTGADLAGKAAGGIARAVGLSPALEETTGRLAEIGKEWGSALSDWFNRTFLDNFFTRAYQDAAVARVRQATLMLDTEMMLNPKVPGITGDLFPKGALFEPPQSGKIDKGSDKKDPYKEAIKYAEEFIAKQELEVKVMGMTEEAANSLRFAMDLVNKATNDNNQITAQQEENLRKLAAQMAATKQAADTAKFMQDYQRDSEAFMRSQQLEAETMYMGAQAAAAHRMAYEALERAKKANVEITPELIESIYATSSAMAAVQQDIKDQKELLDLGRNVFVGFFSDMREGLMNGQTMWEAFGNAALNALNRIAEKLISMAAEKLFESAFGGGTSGGAGFLGSIFSGIVGSLGGGIGGGAEANLSGFALGGGPVGPSGAFAEGGRPPIGQPYLVGENGPEIRVDDRPGTIFNQDQWGAMGGNGESVVIYQTNNFGSDVTKSTMAVWAREVEERATRGAYNALLENRRRGGQSKQVFSGGR